MSGSQLAIFGGGPKAIAIASLAKIHSDLGIGQPISITIFEKHEIGAHWKGGYGYTDGWQHLCTPIERDLGFPYHTLPASIAERMHEQFSWSTFLVEKARTSEGERSYSKWVDNGRKPPTHFEFHEYLKWAARKALPNIVVGEVTRLKPVNGKWEVSSRKGSAFKPKSHSQHFDGVVVTGPGPARSVPRIGKGNRVFDGRDYWQKKDAVGRILGKLNVDDQIVIIGAGGTVSSPNPRTFEN